MKPTRFVLLLLIVAALLPAIFSCGSREAAATPTVAVTIPPLAFFAEQIGGDRIVVTTLAPASADPETFEPSMAQMRRLSDSRLLLTTGLLPFEEKLLASLPASAAVVNLSDSIDLITGTHGHDEADPHIWTSLRNARIMARQVERALSETYPESAGYFAENLAALDARLAREDAEVARRLLPCRGRSFLVWHPSLSYFARDYGLRQITLGEEHKEIPLNLMRSRIDKVVADSASVFFYQKEFDPRQARVVTDATGLRPVEISPLSPDIISTITTAADAFTKP